MKLYNFFHQSFVSFADLSFIHSVYLSYYIFLFVSLVSFLTFTHRLHSAVFVVLLHSAHSIGLCCFFVACITMILSILVMFLSSFYVIESVHVFVFSTFIVFFIHYNCDYDILYYMLYILFYAIWHIMLDYVAFSHITLYIIYYVTFNYIILYTLHVIVCMLYCIMLYCVVVCCSMLCLNCCIVLHL